MTLPRNWMAPGLACIDGIERTPGRGHLSEGAAICPNASTAHGIPAATGAGAAVGQAHQAMPLPAVLASTTCHCTLHAVPLQHPGAGIAGWWRPRNV